jgi:hypothetical protein
MKIQQHPAVKLGNFELFLYLFLSSVFFSFGKKRSAPSSPLMDEALVAWEQTPFAKLQRLLDGLNWWRNFHEVLFLYLFLRLISSLFFSFGKKRSAPSSPLMERNFNVYLMDWIGGGTFIEVLFLYLFLSLISSLFFSFGKKRSAPSSPLMNSFGGLGTPFIT